MFGITVYNKNNKNLETYIEVQGEDQKSKAASC